MPILKVVEEEFGTIEELNEYIEKNKIKKTNILSIENIMKEEIYSYPEKRMRYRLIYVVEKELLNE